MAKIAKAIGIALIYVILNNLSVSWTLPLESLGVRWYLEYYQFIQGFIKLFLVLSILFFLNKNSKHRFFDWSIKRKWYMIAFLAGVLFVFLQLPLNYFYDFLFNSDYYRVFTFEGLQSLDHPNLLASILFSPVAEELLCRGYIQGRLLKGLNPNVVILASATIFALLHAPFENLILNDNIGTWHHSYITFFGGIIASLLYQKTRSTAPSMVFHFAWNFTANVI